MLKVVVVLLIVGGLLFVVVLCISRRRQSPEAEGWVVVVDAAGWTKPGICRPVGRSPKTGEEEGGDLRGDTEEETDDKKIQCVNCKPNTLHSQQRNASSS
jgi:hypothetical protein